MVKIEFTYYEITDSDFTGVEIKVVDKENQVAAVYRNFDSEDYPKPAKGVERIWKNQTESFEVDSVERAKKIIESNRGYEEVIN